MIHLSDLFSLDNSLLEHHVHSVDPGHWLHDGHLTHHLPDFYQHHLIGDFHHVLGQEAICLPTDTIQPLTLDL